MSAVAKRYVPDSFLRRSEAIPLQVGSGDFIYSLGNADIHLQFGTKVFQISAVVVDTNAFQAVLGTDFTESEHFGGLLTRPTRVLIDGQEFPVQDCVDPKPEIKRLFRMFKTESYSLTKPLRKEVLSQLEISPHQVCVDVFANHTNFQEPFYLTKSNSAFRYSWSKLLRTQDDFLWANPPFSQLSKVVTKVCLEPTRLILVHPDWVDQYWSPLLREITVSRVQISSGTPIYVSDRTKKPLPSPLWNTQVSLVNTEVKNVSPEKLDPKLVRWLQRTSKNCGFEDLQGEMKKYPKADLTTVEESTQVQVQVVPPPPVVVTSCDHVPFPADRDHRAREEQAREHQEAFQDDLQGIKQEKVQSWLKEIDHEGPYVPLPNHSFSDSDLIDFLADVSNQIENQFQSIQETDEEVQHLFFKSSQPLEETLQAKPTGKFPRSQKDLAEITKLVNDRILGIETQKLAQEKSEKLFKPQESENLHGELEKDLEKYRNQPRLFELLTKYKEIFGPLPPPSAGCPLVQMDIELKEEWIGKPLRQRCWPMPIVDQEEINMQAEELLKAGLAEAFPPGQIPHFCSPTFLVDKKDSKTRRMVIQFRKLNSRTKPHAAYLPNMEQMVESLAKCRFKSKLDMRSGFWQVGLSERAKDLTTFCIPSGRCFRPLCMMFGLQGAPGVFQELMEILISQCKQDSQVRKILESGHLASFFDDTGIGSQTLDEHYYLLEKYFQICQKNQIRIKLTKCSFLDEEIEYLGFTLGWGTWRPSQKGIQAILRAQVKNQKDLRTFLGAMNFYRRHVKNFTFSSAPLTELLKKNVKWRWTDTEEKCFQELKNKISALEVLGVPKPFGEIIMVTDSSDLGGGSTLFQWQCLDPLQIPEKFRLIKSQNLPENNFQDTYGNFLENTGDLLPIPGHIPDVFQGSLENSGHHLQNAGESLGLTGKILVPSTKHLLVIDGQQRFSHSKTSSSTAKLRSSPTQNRKYTHNFSPATEKLSTPTANFSPGEVKFTLPETEKFTPGDILLQPAGNFSTSGANVDGSFKHNYPENFRLVPLGHWNWKWSEARQKYHSWEQEILSGVLTLASQSRIVSHLPIVWFTDNEAATSFLEKEPPINKRLRRMYCFLCQLKLKICHLPGLKNELCDFLSRNAFEDKYDTNFEDLVHDAFEKMDSQLDLWLKKILFLSDKFPITEQDYQESEFQEIWSSLTKGKTDFQQGNLWFRTDGKLFCERKLVIPLKRVDEVLKVSHESNNHPGAERTLLFFLGNFYCSLSRTELFQKCKNLCDACAVCLLSKPNRSTDRGEISSLSIPQICNDLVYIDFIQMDPYNNFDYILTIVDALSRFVQFIPCQKGITGEGTLKLILERWISVFGKPNTIHSDNDVRFKNPKGFYQSIFRALSVDVHFSIPRHPASNGLCENVNKSFLQNMRSLSLSLKTNNWPQLVAYCTWLMNSQISPLTNQCPSEMFLGKPAWKTELISEPNTNPSTQEWIMQQILSQEKASQRLQKLRESTLKYANRKRVPSTFQENDYVLVNNRRWPQKKFPKLSSPWQGPFKILKAKFNSLQISASPTLGGIIDVPLEMCKKWDLQLDDEVFAEGEPFEDQEDSTPKVPDPGEDELMTDAEQAELGFYNVAQILKHKFQQGWKFLVWWENFPISQATWEPLSSFLLPNGSVNTVFKEYCLQNNLTNILQKALSDSCK